jgi:flavin-dependent dehydrogenase
MTLDRIAVVGGGPAGAMAAAHLAAGGRRVVLVEEKLAWEKPCGGGITAKALKRYPFLNDGAPRNSVDSCVLIGPSGVRFELELKPPVAIFSRKALNGLMLDRARTAGAEVVQDRVVRIEPSLRQNQAKGWGNQLLSESEERPTQAKAGLEWATRSLGVRRPWRLTLYGGEVIEASYLVLAGGARSQFRGQFSRAFTPDDLMATAGYYVPGTSRRMTIRFLPGLEGYIWTFPRCDHFSAGICGKMNSLSTAELRRMLEVFLQEEGFALGEVGGKSKRTQVSAGHHGANLGHAHAPHPTIPQPEFYSHVLPTPTRETLMNAPICGDGWAMVGDAAGFVDPITGEGLYYAFRSAELLAEALIEGRPERYEAAVRADFLPELMTAASLAPRFFLGTLLGAPVTERMVRFGSASEVFKRLLSDLFAGTQGYVDLRERGYRMLPRVLFGMGWGQLLEEA